VLSGDFSSFRIVDEISAIILSTNGVQGFSTNVTVNGKDYMEAFGGQRTESRMVKKKKRCHERKMNKEGKGKKKSCGCGKKKGNQ
jgi:hypothetical protein